MDFQYLATCTSQEADEIVVNGIAAVNGNGQILPELFFSQST